MRSVGTKKIVGLAIRAFPDFKIGLQKIILGCVFLCLAVLLPSACKGTFDQLGVKVDLEQKQLSNGLKVIFIEDHSIPVVSYQTWYRVGSVDERMGATGLAHLFEHLMFKGTEKFGPKQFFTQLESKGAEVNAFTSRDYTVYYQNFVPELLPRVVEMEADRMMGLILNPDTVNTERMVVLEERKLKTDNSPSGLLQEALWALAYRTHPYHWPVVGYAQDIVQMPLETVQEFYRKYYHPSNAVVIVAGDFDSDFVFKKIEKAYGAIPQGKKNLREGIPVEPEQKEERRLVLREQVASEMFAWGYHITQAEDDDSYALDVLSNILFFGRSSRAHQRLVENKNLVLGISGASFTPLFPGLMMISGVMKGNASAEEAEKEIQALLEEVQNHGVTEDEVQVAVKQLTVQLVDSVRTSFGLAQLIGTVMMVFDDPKRFSDDLNKYFKVTTDDVKRVANRYLIPNNRSVVVMKPVAVQGGGR